VNIAIRIASPGNNGPVSQSNVSIAVGLPTSPSTADRQIGDASVHVDVQLPGLTEALPSVDAALSAVAPIASVAEAVEELEGLIATIGFSQTGDGAQGLTAPIVPPTSVAFHWLPAGPCGDVGQGVRRLPDRARGGIWFERCIDSKLTIAPCRCLPPPPPQAAAYAAAVVWGSGTSTSAAAMEETARLVKTNRARPPVDRSSPRAPIPSGISGAALGAAPAGSASGGALPLSLLIPLVVALLDLCRRIAVTKVLFPSGLMGGTFDPPG
jgi:hypothetical protein